MAGADASTQPGRADAGGSVAEFATGLTNPRHLRFGPDGLLYVAEAGVGGEQLATTCPAVDNQLTQPGPYMAGFTGRISRIGPDGTRETVADALPSSHDGLGDGFGPSDIAWMGGRMYAVIEGGGCSRGLPDHPAGIVRIKRDGSYRYVADISAFIRANPVANEPICGPQGDCEPDASRTRCSPSTTASTWSRRTTTASCASTPAAARSPACMTSPSRIRRRSS